MGYNSSYNLTWERQKGFAPAPNCACNRVVAGAKFCPDCGSPIGFKDLDQSIGEYIASHDDMQYAVSTSGSTEESCKWYEHEKDMVAMSLAFPRVLFKLHGEGEESGDIWDAYFLDGKSQKHKAKVMIDDVDPNGWK